MKRLTPLMLVVLVAGYRPGRLRWRRRKWRWRRRDHGVRRPLADAGRAAARPVRGDTGIKIRVRYGDGTDLALGILEEGENSAVDVYYGQDVGALGALKEDGLLAPLKQEILDKVEPGVPVAGGPLGRHLRPLAGHRLQHRRGGPGDAARLDPRLHRPEVEREDRDRARAATASPSSSPRCASSAATRSRCSG